MWNKWWSRAPLNWGAKRLISMATGPVRFLELPPKLPPRVPGCRRLSTRSRPTLILAEASSVCAGARSDPCRCRRPEARMLYLTRLFCRSHINPGSNNASSKPIPHPLKTRMSSQFLNGVPSIISPATHASMSPAAIPVSCVLLFTTLHLSHRGRGFDSRRLHQFPVQFQILESWTCRSPATHSPTGFVGGTYELGTPDLQRRLTTRSSSGAANVAHTRSPAR